LEEIQEKFDAAMAEKKAAEDEAKYFSDRLDLAKRLIAALGSENERWGNIIISIDQDINVIVGDVLIASAFISYIGPFSKQMRDILIKEKFMVYMKELKIPMSELSDPVAMLTDDATKALWNTQGLPPDLFSTENGTIMCNATRYPLLIDPQL